MLDKPRRALPFKKGQFVVHPVHGVGQIIDINLETAAEFTVECYAIRIDNGTIRTPVSTIKDVGLRAIGGITDVGKVVAILKVPEKQSRRKKGLWNKRAIGYEAMLASGNLTELAKLIQSLHRDTGEEVAGLSYSEHALLHRALEILIPEIALIQMMSSQEALESLSKATGKKFPYFQIGRSMRYTFSHHARYGDRSQRMGALAATLPSKASPSTVRGRKKVFLPRSAPFRDTATQEVSPNYRAPPKKRGQPKGTGTYK